MVGPLCFWGKFGFPRPFVLQDDAGNSRILGRRGGLAGSAGEKSEAPLRLSVILPCFNGAATIAVQLEALTRQTWSDGWEVVVCNNGSTDGSMAIVARYRDRLPGLRIVDVYEGMGPRRGVARSYAVGFAAARGDAFVLCEADDEVGEGWLHTLGTALRAHPFVAAAIDYDRLNASRLRPMGLGQQSVEAGLTTFSGPTYWPYASGCSLGLRRSTYLALGDPDETCGASWDTDYCWRAHQAGIALTFVPEACVHYRLRSTLLGAFRQGKSWSEGSIALERKYGAPRSVLCAVKHQFGRVRDLARHLRRAPRALSGATPLASWVWGLGWLVAIVPPASPPGAVARSNPNG
jgi:glycosyltransferase involved in cell wall biosynthesis